jgi:hypothetical protein
MGESPGSARRAGRLPFDLTMSKLLRRAPGRHPGCAPAPNTVKSQAISIYRKLEASSRSQAVARSRELGLLEG